MRRDKYTKAAARSVQEYFDMIDAEGGSGDSEKQPKTQHVFRSDFASRRQVSSHVFSDFEEELLYGFLPVPSRSGMIVALGRRVETLNKGKAGRKFD